MINKWSRHRHLAIFEGPPTQNRNCRPPKRPEDKPVLAWEREARLRLRASKHEAISPTWPKLPKTGRDYPKMAELCPRWLNKVSSRDDFITPLTSLRQFQTVCTPPQPKCNFQCPEWLQDGPTYGQDVPQDAPKTGQDSPKMP